jgi:hypothetical protein
MPRAVPMLLRLVPRLQCAFPGVQIKLRGDTGFALPLLYEFCEFFGMQYAFGIPATAALAFARPPAVFAFAAPPAGPSRTCSAPSSSMSKAVDRTA